MVTEPAWVATEQAARERGRDFVLDHLGVEYILGGELGRNGIRGLDCSGMVKLSVQEMTSNQVVLTHLAARQYNETVRIFPPGARHIGKLRMMDLVFYEHGFRGYGHVAVYLGMWHGIRWVGQATMTGVLSEVIPMDFYVKHQAYGRVRWGHYNDVHEQEAFYNGRGVNTARFSHLFKS